LIDDFKLSLYSKEIFVFTPQGDLRRLPKDSTVLDFAFDIHTGVGSSCTGAKVNGKIVPIRYVLNNGDRVEIITSKNQKPKQDWLDFVATSKAKAKIKQSLNEELFKEAEHGKEIIKRRFRNWKIVYNDENIRKLIHHYKFKTAVDLYYQVANEKIDLAEIKEILTHEEAKVETAPILTTQEAKTSGIQEKASDFLVIDEKLGNLDYKLSKCCNPIFGDPIFGFVTINEGIKIHRTNCPNAAQLLNKYGYRIVKAGWSKSDDQTFFEASIKITGIDELGVVSRLTDVISRDLKVNMRSISIESQNGYYEGLMKIMVKDIRHLDVLIGRLQKVKGVVSATRLDLHG
jgi:guanosine-3',5'-bis(diphosphate) 3'-pyrophosphohydrolase